MFIELLEKVCYVDVTQHCPWSRTAKMSLLLFSDLFGGFGKFVPPIHPLRINEEPDSRFEGKSIWCQDVLVGYFGRNLVLDWVQRYIVLL